MATNLSTLLPLVNIPRCPEPVIQQALRNACREFCRETEWWRAEVTADWLGANAVTSLLVSGSGNSFLNEEWIISGVNSDRFTYSNLFGGYKIAWNLGFPKWYIQNDAGTQVYWISSSDVQTPDLATGWISGGSGTLPAPTIKVYDKPLTYSYPNAQIIRTRWVSVDGRVQQQDQWSVSHDGVLTFDPELPDSADVVEAEIVLMPTITANSVDDLLVERFGEYIAAGARFMLKADKGSEVDPNPWYDPNGAMLARDLNMEGVGNAKAEIYTKRKSGNRTVFRGRSYWK